MMRYHLKYHIDESCSCFNQKKEKKCTWMFSWWALKVISLVCSETCFSSLSLVEMEVFICSYSQIIFPICFLIQKAYHYVFLHVSEISTCLLRFWNNIGVDIYLALIYSFNSHEVQHIQYEVIYSDNSSLHIFYVHCNVIGGA